MKQAAHLLGFVVSTLQLSPLCRQVNILEVNHFSDQQFTFKVRAEMANGRVLQIRLYYNQGHADYAYQLLHHDKPVERWDNKEHFSHLHSYPHHYHAADGQVLDSPLNGNPEHDLRPPPGAYFFASRSLTRKANQVKNLLRRTTWHKLPNYAVRFRCNTPGIPILFFPRWPIGKRQLGS